MARPRGAMASALRRIPNPHRLNGAALVGHARLFIHPAYARLVNSEPYVKRLIPILIILFVVALAAMRGVALYLARADIDSAAEERLALIAKAVTASLPKRLGQISLAEPSPALQGRLENSLPPLATATGARFCDGSAGAGGRGVAGRSRRRSDATSTTSSVRASRLPRSASRQACFAWRHRPTRSDATVASQPRQSRIDRGAAADLSDLHRLAGTVSRETTVFVATTRTRHPRLRLPRADGARAGGRFNLFGDADSLPTALRRGHSGLWDGTCRAARSSGRSRVEILGLDPPNRAAVGG